MTGSLIPKTPTERADFIRGVLQRERSMREHVFRDKPAMRERKVAEINEALDDLADLREQVEGTRAAIEGDYPGLGDPLKLRQQRDEALEENARLREQVEAAEALRAFVVYGKTHGGCPILTGCEGCEAWPDGEDGECGDDECIKALTAWSKRAAYRKTQTEGGADNARP